LEQQVQQGQLEPQELQVQQAQLVLEQQEPQAQLVLEQQAQQAQLVLEQQVQQVQQVQQEQREQRVQLAQQEPQEPQDSWEILEEIPCYTTLEHMHYLVHHFRHLLQHQELLISSAV
jgi:hypothetical protein